MDNKKEKRKKGEMRRARKGEKRSAFGRQSSLGRALFKSYHKMTTLKNFLLSAIKMAIVKLDKRANPLHDGGIIFASRNITLKPIKAASSFLSSSCRPVPSLSNVPANV